VHKRHEVPDDVEAVTIPADATRDGRVWLPRLLVATGLAVSNGEARRAVAAGGVRLDGEPVTDADAEFESEALQGKVLSVGRRRFVRLT
jgi:tyrosyl-tRNA synthetase